MKMEPTLKQLREDEGERRLPYTDTVGKLTIGVGFNLTDVGLEPEEIDFILRRRVGHLVYYLGQVLPWFSRLDDVRQAVLVNMAYNLGPEPFDHDGFKDWPIFLSQIEQSRYAEAAANMLSTKWARQVGRRAARLAEMMRTGNWPKELEVT